MQTVLNVVARFDKGYGKILESLKSNKCADEFRKELNTNLIIGEGVEKILEKYNFKNFSCRDSVDSVEIMSTDEFYYFMRAYKISLPPSEITVEEYTEYCNLKTTITKSQNYVEQVGKVANGFISKVDADDVSLDLNIGTNFFVRDGKYFKKVVSLSDTQSWVI
jgi:hypothetical protein